MISAHTELEGTGDTVNAADSSRPGWSALAQSVLGPQVPTGRLDLDSLICLGLFPALSLVSGLRLNLAVLLFWISTLDLPVWAWSQCAPALCCCLQYWPVMLPALPAGDAASLLPVGSLPVSAISRQVLTFQGHTCLWCFCFCHWTYPLRVKQRDALALPGFYFLS